MQSLEEQVQKILLLVDSLEREHPRSDREQLLFQDLRNESLRLLTIREESLTVDLAPEELETEARLLRKALKGSLYEKYQIKSSDFGPNVRSSGWHEPETKAGQHRRWSGAKLPSTIVFDDDGTVEWVGLYGNTVTDAQAQSEFRFQLDDRAVPHVQFGDTRKTAFWVRIPPGTGPRELSLFFRDTVVPKALGIGRDERRLGYQVHELHIAKRSSTDSPSRSGS